MTCPNQSIQIELFGVWKGTNCCTPNTQFSQTIQIYNWWSVLKILLERESDANVLSKFFPSKTMEDSKGQSAKEAMNENYL